MFDRIYSIAVDVVIINQTFKDVDVAIDYIGMFGEGIIQAVEITVQRAFPGKGTIITPIVVINRIV